MPAHFRETDRGTIARLLADFPLSTLVSVQPDGLSGDPIPLLYDANRGPEGTLIGHVARANPLWRHADGQRVLAVFMGPQGYVSPSWYASKAESGKVVPTWNYAAVHLHGRLRAIDDPEWLRGLVTRLTATQEAPRAAPWAVTDAPEDYVAAMLRAIVGIEIDVERIEAKYKLSQNRSAADRAGTANGFAAEPEPSAQAMSGWIPVA